MSAQIDGASPAFPVNVPGCGDNGWHGMSLRDWFAGLAMQGAAARSDRNGTPKEIAEYAYRCAEAMIAHRHAAPSPNSEG